ncbi:Haloacid dehalogenase-like hydrolase (HAD) superfamily protein [Striga hermonthica]|uniref:Haloacid dehalogenase-like hydrolase (HAD) superfamily protein n=1 Tax=Striga hermonthica TaxID=68872 RepID=A0A9N7MNW9_STRHE|nr:Haloacid dehalogenase-like hydrolase (HAD) superfamily protein [Striga hermonthica]
MDSHFASDSAFECLIFDLDDTLYSSKTGIGQAVKRNVQDFLVEKCGFSESEAPIVNAEFFRTYGSSLAGLRASGYNINPNDYHSFVHGILPYDLIRPDSRLRSLLQSIKQRKIIFTNSDRIHAIKALDRIGIRDCFEKIICFETMNPSLSTSTRPDEFPVVLKPSIEAMNIAIDAAEVDPRRTLFFDDNVKNVAAGKAVGLRTVLVGRSIRCKGADYAVETLGEMVQVIPALWVNEEENENERVIHKRATVGEFPQPPLRAVASFSPVPPTTPTSYLLLVSSLVSDCPDINKQVAMEIHFLDKNKLENRQAKKLKIRIKILKFGDKMDILLLFTVGIN